MIVANNCRGKVVYVLGLGTSGSGALNSLLAAEAVVFAWDDNAKSRIPIEGVTYVNYDNLNLQEIDLFIVSPGINIFWPKPHPAVAYARRHLIPVVCDIDLFMCNRSQGAKCIGVTGTNGKSTTVSLMSHVLNSTCKNSIGRKSVIGGNIGNSALGLPTLSDDGVYILELSSYQLELMEVFDFEVSVLLNITQDHVSRHNGMIGYANAKQKIFQNLNLGGYGVIGLDDQYCCEIYNTLIQNERLIPISGYSVPENGIGWHNGQLIDNFNTSQKVILSKTEIGELYGNHNYQNVAAAYAICRIKGISSSIFIDALKTFRPLRHRQEIVDKSIPFKVINDSKATNVDACVKSLESAQNIYWIAGGQAKSSDFSGLSGSHLKNIKKVFLIGSSAELISKFLIDQGIDHEICGTIDVATEKALNEAYIEYAKLKSDIAVILAPACASFDQFNGFEHRGDVFINLVKDWWSKAITKYKNGN